MEAIYTSAEVIQIIIALGVLMTTLGGVIVSIINSAKIAKVEAKADVIAGHVNSAATASTNKIEALQKEIATLIAVMAEKKQDAALLAQSVAHSSSTPTSVIVENKPDNPVPTTNKKD